jgi:hypothetical protein
VGFENIRSTGPCCQKSPHPYLAYPSTGSRGRGLQPHITCVPTSWRLEGGGDSLKSRSNSWRSSERIPTVAIEHPEFGDKVPDLTLPSFAQVAVAMNIAMTRRMTIWNRTRLCGRFCQAIRYLADESACLGCHNESTQALGVSTCVCRSTSTQCARLRQLYASSLYSQLRSP